MKLKRRHALGLAAISLLVPAAADTLYSGLLDTAIPTDFTGATVTIDGGVLNPFFGGVGVANNDLLQPFRDGTGNLDTLLNFSAGTVLDASTLHLSTGYGGSQDHVGTTFTAGNQGYLGFKLNGTDYGWMRVVFTNNTGGAVIRDWAYDDSGGAIATGNVLQSGSTVTLNSASGSFTLGTQVTSSNSLVKTGAGTTTVTGANTFTGSTTVSGGTLALASGASLANTSSVTVQSGGTLTGSGTIGGSTTIESLGVHTPGSGPGLQTFASGLTYSTGSSLVWELTSQTDDLGLRASDYDGIDLSGGALSIASGVTSNLVFNSSGSTVDWTDAFWDLSRSWLVYENANSPSLASGTIFDTITVSDDSLSQSFDLAGGAFTWNQSGNDVYLVYTAVPEPHAALLGGLGLLMLLRRRRNE
jgi:autotransporter-associated beta strand protein